MAFNNLGPVTYLAPGQSAYWWYDRGGQRLVSNHCLAGSTRGAGTDRLGFASRPSPRLD